MGRSTVLPVFHDNAQVLMSLLEVGVQLSIMPDRRHMLEVTLSEARKLARAEAGTLYLIQDGMLRFVSVQNDQLGSTAVDQHLLGKQMPVTFDSLAGFVASTGRTMNIQNSHRLPAGAPFRINREFDAVTGYAAQSIMAIPLKCPNGEVIGVLELINCINEAGHTVQFPPAECTGILALASMAAVTVHNAMLQDQIKKAHLDTIMRLSVAAEYRDDDTGDHVRRISYTSGVLARQMGLDTHQCELIEYASPMHDIGKIGIPDSILRKPGPLTPEEEQVVQKHTTIGAEILADSRNELMQTAHVVALNHHERWDGSGYPHHVRGDEIPMPGRVVALADAFDAMVSKRCYKDAYPIEASIDMIRRERERHFDPAATDAFIEAADTLSEYYGGKAGVTS